MSQKPDQHGQEEHCVSYENAGSIDEAMVRMLDYAGVHDGAVHRVELVLFWVSISSHCENICKSAHECQSFGRAGRGHETIVRKSGDARRTPHIQRERGQPCANRNQRHNDIAVPYCDSVIEEHTR